LSLNWYFNALKLGGDSLGFLVYNINVPLGHWIFPLAHGGIDDGKRCET
jgi:hypothetical protein